MEHPVGHVPDRARHAELQAWMGGRRALIITALIVGLCTALIAMPTPAGLSQAGQRVLAVAVLAIGLWCTEMIPAGVTGIILVAASGALRRCAGLSGGNRWLCRASGLLPDRGLDAWLGSFAEWSG